MSEFLKLAYELIAKIIYNIVIIFVDIFRLLFTGWADYAVIWSTYFFTLSLVGKIFAILLAIVLIAIPVIIVVLLVRHIILTAQLRADSEDNATLYREIGRLNKQVLDLVDEKNKILALKVNTVSGGAPLAGAEALLGTTGTLSGIGTVITEDGEGNVVNGVAGGVVGGAVAGAVAGGPVIAGAGGSMSITTAEMSEETMAKSAIMAAEAQAKAKAEIEQKDQERAIRFPKLTLVDQKYEVYERPSYNTSITLEEFVETYRKFACSRLHLYYTPEIIRRFVAGMASSKILILEGISGTGKTSLPYSFSRYLNNPATLVSVQPSFRDRTELLGYFNEFSKRFNETEFLRALYEANYREDPSFIVLDEMNLARIEYYFAEMLSVLEMPSHDEWVIDLVPTAWLNDPKLMSAGKITVSDSTWFVGTANNDDSTFTITDKVYDRAMPIELNERADAFECEDTEPVFVSSEYLQSLFAKAKQDHPITEATITKMTKLDQYLQTRFKLAFGNRIMKQMYDFIPVYVACGGSELGGLDYIVARKVLKKFESMNVTFVRDEIKGLIVFIEKTFGKTAMADSKDYLNRIQNLY